MQQLILDLDLDLEWEVLPRGFYLLHQRHCGLREQDVKAGDEAKPPGEGRVECHDLRPRRGVEGLLEVEVVFVVASHQQPVGAEGGVGRGQRFMGVRQTPTATTGLISHLKTTLVLNCQRPSEGQEEEEGGSVFRGQGCRSAMLATR